jgi:hypothetical protein
MLPAIPLFLSLARTAFNAVASNYIDSSTATQFINLGFQAAQSLVDADMKLVAIRDELVLKKNEAAERGEKWVPEQSEIDAIWDRINARDAEWDKI